MLSLFTKLQVKICFKSPPKIGAIISSNDTSKSRSLQRQTDSVPKLDLNVQARNSNHHQTHNETDSNPTVIHDSIHDNNGYPVILAAGLKKPTSVAFDQNGQLWFTESDGANLCRLSGSNIVRMAQDGMPDGITFDPVGRVYYCDIKNRVIRRYDPASGRTKTLVERVDGKSMGLPKNLAFDAMGNLAFTCPGDSTSFPTGYACVLPRRGSARRIGSGFYYPSGLAFSPDGKYLVIAETGRQRLWRGYWDMKRARWSEIRPWAHIGGSIGPAGLAYAADGRLIVTTQGDGAIKSITPDGVVETVNKLSDYRPTNCAFDPHQSLGLVVTETNHGLLLCYPLLGPGAPVFARSRKQSCLGKCFGAFL